MTCQHSDPELETYTGRYENEYINMVCRTKLSGCQGKAKVGLRTIKSATLLASVISASSRTNATSSAWPVRCLARAPSCTAAFLASRTSSNRLSEERW